MGIRENKIEKYLHEQVVAIGGTTRKWVSPGVDGVPDRIVFLHGLVVFVELKTEDGALTAYQVREHNRLKENGALVFTAYGKDGVDLIITALKSRKISDASSTPST